MKKITLIPGDGIGPEVTYAAKRLIDAFNLNIDWDIQIAGEEAIVKYNTPLPESLLNSIRKNRIALKGPVTTPVASGFSSINVKIRKEFDLFSNVRPIKTIKGVKSRYDDVDLIVIRENTEDLYTGFERMTDEDTAESIKRFTRYGCERIIRYAFEYAKQEGRKKVTAVHKANIMKLTDGMFLNIAKDVSKEYKNIIFEDIIIDALCMKLVMEPTAFDVLVLPNLYGDIVSDLCAGLVGGLGVVPGANIGRDIAVFEPVHGSAPDIAGKNLANPTAMFMCSINMLKHINENETGMRIESAIHQAFSEGKNLTRDMGGYLSTNQYTDYIIELAHQQNAYL